MTKDIFDQIAPSWYSFRHWSRFRQELDILAQSWQKGRLLNIGCAHGPDFLPFSQSFELHGIDFSGEMLKFSQRYAQKFRFVVQPLLADACHLPYTDQTFDWAISVATYHHIKYPEERQKAFYELGRVLKPGGEAFITVWNHWQPRFWFKSSEVTVPWRTKEKTFYRYYYLFSYGKLEKLARQAGFEILKSFPESSYRYPVKFFSRNICLLIRKNKLPANPPFPEHIDRKPE